MESREKTTRILVKLWAGRVRDHLKTPWSRTHTCGHMHRNYVTDKGTSGRLECKVGINHGCIDSPWTPWDKVFPSRKLKGHQSPCTYLPLSLLSSHFLGDHGASIYKLYRASNPSSPSSLVALASYCSSLILVYTYIDPVLFAALGFHSHYRLLSTG